VWTEWAPKPVVTLCRKEISLSPAVIRIPHRPVRSLVCIPDPFIKLRFRSLDSSLRASTNENVCQLNSVTSEALIWVQHSKLNTHCVLETHLNVKKLIGEKREEILLYCYRCCTAIFKVVGLEVKMNNTQDIAH
jgi:hypothetical protein